jgi:hypothetical protein
MADDALIQGIIKNNLALISRFELSYPGFISSFDEDVKNILGIFPRDVSIAEKANVDKLIKRGFTFRRLLALARYRNFPGRNIVKFFYQRAKSTLGILR